MAILSLKEGVIIIPIVLLSILIFFLYLPDLLGYQQFTVMEKTNILLTFALAIFASVEGYSTYMQAKMDDRKNKIEEARNELEKAYGPIYALLNKNLDRDEGFTKLKLNEKIRLDEIMSTYSFMFPQRINDFWQNNIRNLEVKDGVEVDMNLFFSGGGIPARFVPEYRLPIEFVNIFNPEYMKKVQNFTDLLKK